MVVEVNEIITYRSTDIHEAIKVDVGNYLEIIQWLRNHKIPFTVEDDGDTMKITIRGKRIFHNAIIVYNTRTRVVDVHMSSHFDDLFEVIPKDDQDYSS